MSVSRWSEWPSSSWIETRSAPSCSSSEAKVCRSACRLTPRPSTQARSAAPWKTHTSPFLSNLRPPRSVSSIRDLLSVGTPANPGSLPPRRGPGGLTAPRRPRPSAPSASPGWTRSGTRRGGWWGGCGRRRGGELGAASAARRCGFALVKRLQADRKTRPIPVCVISDPRALRGFLDQLKRP